MMEDKISYIGEEFTGANFNDLFHDCAFVKLTNSSEKHRGFQFVDGLNIDKNYFNTYDTCTKGGIYFIDIKDAYKWIHYNEDVGTMKYIRRIYIPDDAKVYVLDGKFKTDKIVLYQREIIKNNVYKEFVKNNGYMLQYLTRIQLDKEIYMNAVSQCGYALEHVPQNMIDYDICIESVKQNGYALYYVPCYLMDKELCIEAVKKDICALQYVPNYLLSRDIFTAAFSC